MRFFHIKENNLSSGQALIAVILVMVVALTIGLSVATRNVTNLRLTTEEASSQRALSAAEAGIEQALKSSDRGDGIISSTEIGDANIDKVSIKSDAGQEYLLSDGKPVARNQGVDIWLSDYGTYADPWSGDVEIFWHDTNGSCTTVESAKTRAALDILAVYRPNPATPGLENAEVKHFIYDPCGFRRGDNNFCGYGVGYCRNADGSLNLAAKLTVSPGMTSVAGKDLKYLTRVSFGIAANQAPQPGLLVRVTPLYADAVIGVRGRATDGVTPKNIPEQGVIIESIGSSGNTQRKISVVRGNPTLPEELFYTIFSP